MGRKSKTTLSLVSNATVPSYQLRFEKEDRARLNKICRDKHFLESLENIASRFRSNLEVYLGRSGYKKRRRFLNVLKRRTELLLEALRQGPEGELHFISIEAALSRLRQLGQELTEQEIFSRIEHKKIRCERVSQKLRVCGEDLGLNWSHPCDATELVGGSQDLVPVLEEFHQKILAALSSQKTMTEVVTPTLCRKLMVGELASLFRKHGLKVSDSEPSHFCTCVDHVLALAGDAVLNPRDFLRSTVTEALQDFPSLENSRLKS